MRRRFLRVVRGLGRNEQPLPERMSRGCSTICSHPVWSVDVPIVSGPGRPYSNSLVSIGRLLQPEREGGGRGYAEGTGQSFRIMRKGSPCVLSRGGDEGTVVCKRCNTAGVPRRFRRKERERERKGCARTRKRDEERETTTGIKYSQPQPERSLNCDQTRSRIPTAGGPTNRS